MKIFIIVLTILSIIAYTGLFYYLATQPTEMKCKNVKEGFVFGKTGIVEICDVGTPDYTNPNKCFDISYIDPDSKNNIQKRVKIRDEYYIDVSGYLASLPYGFMASLNKRYYLSKTGISEVCVPGTADYTDSTKCFDVSAINGITKQPVQIKAKLYDTYYIDNTGYVKPVPYGYVATANKHAYEPNTDINRYENALTIYQSIVLDASINFIQQQLNANPPPTEPMLTFLRQELKKYQQEKIDVISSNQTSNSNYTSDNVDITYHADPTATDNPDESSAGPGKMWVKVDGELVAVPYSDVSNTTLYYEPGTYRFNSASYVPNYEESVFLSKLTNEPTTKEVTNTRINQSGFCESTKSSTLQRETKCNSLEPTVCASTACCVLLGGEKCVSGNSAGPDIKSNYSDHTIINRDYYYYQGKCYGNCPG